MALASVALGTARTFLNDDEANVWTDAVLMPKLREAHRELQVKLWVVGSPIVRGESSRLTVTAGQTSLVSTPSDLLAPTSLIEATSPAGVDWEPMTEVSYIPKTVSVSGKLIYWAWREELIKFLGSSSDRSVIVYYRKAITIPTVVSDPIGILFGELYLGARIAAMAAGSVGNEPVFNQLSALSKANFDDVVRANR